jgi:nitroreductase
MSAMEEKELEQGAEPSTDDDWNPVEKVILERRSVRIYKDKQVPENLLRRILEAGRFAPSAGNYQPWRVIVIRDRDIINAMEKDIRMMCKMLKPVLVWETSPLGPVAKLMAKTMTWLLPNKLHHEPYGAIPMIADGEAGIFHGAPTLILLLKDKRGAGKPEVDLGCCGQNIVLAAHSHGLGTCWVGFVELLRQNPIWKKRLGIEYPYEICEGISIGYPVGNPDGMIPREIHHVKWFENGTMKVLT